MRKIMLYALCLFIILVPLSISLFCRCNESFDSIDSSKMTSFLQYSFEGNKFWISTNNDYTFHSLAMIEDGGRVFIQGNICLLAEIVLLSLVIRTKQKHLYPFALGYSIYSLFIFLSVIGDYFLNGEASWYNRLMLWGRYVRALHGFLPVIVYVILFITFLYYVVKDLIMLKNHRVSDE